VVKSCGRGIDARQEARHFKNRERRQEQSDKGIHPPIYDPKIPPQAAKVLCSKGATIAKIAAAFDVAISTICIWKINHPAFFESCKVRFEAATHSRRAQPVRTRRWLHSR
jgi:hypothetical protein